MMPTLATVAERAGVSPATVSRVLNGNYPVAEATRRKVEKAVRELDYVVNAHARALLHSTSGLIGVILNDIADPSYGTIARGIDAAASSMQRLVVTCNSFGDPDQELEYIGMLRRQRADAVILIGSAPEDAGYRRQLAAHAKGLWAQNSRLVLCGRRRPSQRAPAFVVELENREGARHAVEYLIGLGHRRIAHITGPLGRSTAEDRRAGYIDALKDAGIKPDPDLEVSGDYSRESGVQAVEELLDRTTDFTAVFGGNDLMAIGALAAFQNTGMSVPKNVSVIGFDDMPLAQDVTTPLSTVRLPLDAAGRHSVALAFAGEVHTRTVRLKHELVVRKSTAAPRT